MDIKRRNNVKVMGDGPAAMVLAHGFGCDQSMWRFLAPHFAQRYKVVLFDAVGAGGSDLRCYDPDKYGTLHGYASDVLEILDTCTDGPVVFVGHSVSAMTGLLACNEVPDRFSSLVMVAPSPCYINDGDYVGGFSREDIDGLLETLESNYLGWSSNMAPSIMGAPEQPDLSKELTNSFCRTDPTIAKHFARVTFLSDHRADLARCDKPTLILQCTDDFIAPREVGAYMQRQLKAGVLSVIKNVGHCPHLSSPAATLAAIDDFLDGRSP